MKVLASTIDKKYVDQAKQFFSSAYHVGQWHDYMLLITYGVREKDLKWFYDHNILIYPVGHIADGTRQVPSPTLYSRFSLFLDEIVNTFSNIVYYDIDTIINTPIVDLGNVDKFCSVFNPFCKFTSEYMSDVDSPERKELLYWGRNGYRMFAAGMFAYPTGIIKPGSFNFLVDIAKKYNNIVTWPDEVALNFLFPEWSELSMKYNYMIGSYPGDTDFWARLDHHLDSVIHCIGPHKPWDIMGHPISALWRERLGQANSIKAKEFPGGQDNWNKIIEPKI